MLKLINITDECEVTKEFDDYVPFNVEWKHNQSKYRHPLIFWRSGDIMKSLVEIGLDSISGMVRSLTLVLSSENSIINEIFTIGEVTSGRPVFDISTFNEHYFDYIQSFSVIVMLNSVIINFSDKEVIRNIGNKGDIVFSFDKKNELQRIIICNVSNEDRIKIQKTLNII